MKSYLIHTGKPHTQWVLIGMFVALCLGPNERLMAQQAPGQGNPPINSMLPTYVPSSGIEGRFTIAGSNTMQPLMIRLSAAFRRYYPDVKIAVDGRGSKSVTSEGTSYFAPFSEMIQNQSVYRRGDGSDDGHHVSMQVHVMASSRKLAADEIRTFVSRYGYEPTEIPVALETVAVYVHRDNPLNGLTLEQADAIFSQTRHRGGSEDITTWGQLGLDGEWENTPIRLCGRDQASGTRAFVRDHLLLNGEFRQTIKELPGSAMLIMEVARDRYGIGYSGIGYQTSSVRALPLAKTMGMPFVSPSAESASDGSYPLTRLLYLYVNLPPKQKRDPVILEFLKFINSREGQETVVKAGVYSLPMKQIEDNLSLLTRGNHHG